MKALLCKEFGPPETLSYEDVDDPVISSGKVIVDIYSASVNFPDVCGVLPKVRNIETFSLGFSHNCENFR